MNLDDVKVFISTIPWGMLATSDGRKVGVRPMSGLAWNRNELWCATMISSDKVAQIKRVPQAEYCFCNADGRHVRIAGPCSVSTDNAEKLWLHNAVPALKDYFPDPAASNYVVIKMIPDNIRLTNPDFTYSQVELK